jgi:hypothetical protein
VLSRDEAADVVHGVSARLVAGVLRRDDEIHAIGPVPDLLLDPTEINLQLLRGVGHCTKDSQPSGLGNRGDNVTAVGKGKDRELDVK